MQKAVSGHLTDSFDSTIVMLSALYYSLGTGGSGRKMQLSLSLSSADKYLLESNASWCA